MSVVLDQAARDRAIEALGAALGADAVLTSAQDLGEGERQKLRLGHTEFLTKARVQLQDVETLVLAMLRQPHEASGVPLGWDQTGSPNL